MQRKRCSLRLEQERLPVRKHACARRWKPQQLSIQSEKALLPFKRPKLRRERRLRSSSLRWPSWWGLPSTAIKRRHTKRRLPTWVPVSPQSSKMQSICRPVSALALLPSWQTPLRPPQHRLNLRQLVTCRFTHTLIPTLTNSHQRSKISQLIPQPIKRWRL